MIHLILADCQSSQLLLKVQNRNIKPMIVNDTGLADPRLPEGGKFIGEFLPALVGIFQQAREKIRLLNFSK